MNWDYLAGFIDGEGTLTFERYRSRTGAAGAMALLIVFQKKPEVLQEIATFLNDSTVRVRTAVNNSHRLEMRGMRLLPVLKELEPRLIIKKKQAQLLIEFIECRQKLKRRAKFDDHCKNIDAEIRKLNERGNSGKHNETDIAL